MRQTITADQRQLIQWGDEKMALACIAVDLVDLHMQQLDRDLAALQSELEVVTHTPIYHYGCSDTDILLQSNTCNCCPHVPILQLSQQS